MKCPRTIPFLHPGLALGAKRHEGFAEAWNWLIHSFWHMNLGDGLKWKNKWQGYPEIHLAIEAGEGINVKYDGGKVIISTGEGETEEDDYTSGGGGTVPGDDGGEGGGSGGGGAGGGGAGGGGGHGDGTVGGGGGGGAGGGAGGGDGSGGGGDDGGTSCNEFSGDLENGDGDPGLGNDGLEWLVMKGK